MERNKIIAVAALAIGIIAWRMGAMQQEVVPAGMIRVTFGDGSALNVPINQARLFDYFNAMLSSEFSEQQARAVNVPEISSDSFQGLLKDLGWVEQVRAQQRANETEQQAARRIVQTMPLVALDRDRLRLLIAQLQAADFLQQPSLVELYALQISDMIISDASMRLLSQGDQEYGQFIRVLTTDLLPHLRRHIAKNMPKVAIWVEQYTVQHNSSVYSVAISADGNRVVTGFADGTAKIIAWNGNAWVEQYTIRHTRVVNSVAISADGNRVVTGSWDDTAKIVAWNGNAWVEQYTIRHNSAVNSVAISADGNRVVAGFDDKTAKIVAWNGVAWVEQYTIRHNDSVVSVAISADGNKVVTGSRDNTAKIIAWNGDANAWVEQYTIRHDDSVNSVAISADGNRVVTGSNDNTAKIVVWNGNAWVEQYTIRHTRAVNSVAISADGNRVVAGSNDKTAKIVVWNGNAWIEQCTITHNSLFGLYLSRISVAIAADGNRVVMGSDYEAEIVVLDGSACVEQYTIRHKHWVDSVAISADSNRVVTGSRDNTVKIVGLLPMPLPGISDFDTCIFEHLLVWGQRRRQRISNAGWARDIESSITWREVAPAARERLQTLIRETMQQQ